jgi:hypothetical protein
MEDVKSTWDDFYAGSKVMGVEKVVYSLVGFVLRTRPDLGKVISKVVTNFIG